MTGVVKSQENHVHVLILHGFAALPGEILDPDQISLENQLNLMLWWIVFFYTAFATLLPKCRTRLKRKSPIAPLHTQWIREAVSMCWICSTLKHLRAFRQKFNMMWDLFHKYVKQLDFSNISDSIWSFFKSWQVKSYCCSWFIYLWVLSFLIWICKLENTATWNLFYATCTISIRLSRSL